jgi:phosphoribosylaminoimidazole carboxylase PurE protein
MSSATPVVLVIQGSKSDDEALAGCFKTLDALHVPYKRRILSAHRTPDEADEVLSSAAKKGYKVIIAAAGMAAHLAGAAASRSLLPVIGIPLASGTLGGIDALLSTAQMPPGVPVATTGIGPAGAANAALLAARILALSDKALADRLAEHRQQQRSKVLRADSEVSGTDWGNRT